MSEITKLFDIHISICTQKSFYHLLLCCYFNCFFFHGEKFSFNIHSMSLACVCVSEWKNNYARAQNSLNCNAFLSHAHVHKHHLTGGCACALLPSHNFPSSLDDFFPCVWQWNKRKQHTLLLLCVIIYIFACN